MSLNKTVGEAQNIFGFNAENGDNGFVEQSIEKLEDGFKETLMPYANMTDISLLFDYSERTIRPPFLQADVPTDFQKEIFLTYVANVLNSNKYNLETLIGTLNLDYDPIENYRMTEKEKYDNSYNYGAQKSETDNEYGEVVNDTKINHGLNSVKEEKAPYDTSDYFSNTKTTQEAFEDGEKTTTNQHKDKVINNVNEYSNDDEGKRELTRSGNIGVTTSQQMIQSQRDLANINIVEYIAKLIVDNVCEGTVYFA